MLDERGIPYRYRDYRDEPLSETEIRRLLELLDVHPGDLLRSRDRAFRELGLSRDDPAEELVTALVDHPTLLQRPIGILEGRAVIGRPPEKLLSLADGVGRQTGAEA